MSSELKRSRFIGIKQSLVKCASTENNKTISKDAQTAFGLVQILNTWVRAQRKLDLQISAGKLTPEQKAFWVDDVRKNGCIFPPSEAALPDVATFDLNKVTGLTDEDLKEIGDCLDILSCSYSSWALQSQSTLNQHNVAIAVGVIQLNRDLKKIYKAFLGENIIWKIFGHILGLIQEMAPHFSPWHGVIQATREENDKQMVRALNHKEEDIGDVLGAGMASTTVLINERYRGGISKVIAAVKGMAGHTENGEQYLSSNVNKHLKGLLRVSITIIQQPVGYFKFLMM